MKLPIIRLSALITFVIILVFFLLFIPSFNKKNKGTQGTTKNISSSLFVSGSNEKLPLYQSVDIANTEDTLHSIEKISLATFLQKDTSTTDEITIPVSNIERAELKKYGNEVGKISDTYLPETLDEVSILSAFVTKPEDQNARNELLSLSKRYINISNKLLSIETPSSISLFHKDFMSVHQVVGDALRTLSESKITEEALTAYNKVPPQYINAYLNLAQYLRVRGVYFDKFEPGSLFTLPF
ncbi:hypothetical protein HQ403_02045 [Candidatus Kaiserbacteria bacterium]|nr:hypothetical protein [Candidatus Kaiserbacteria bacterium]